MKIQMIAIALMTATISWSHGNPVLTWEQCIEKARVYNPDLVSARSALRELEYEVTSASAGFLPSVSASAGASLGQSEDSDRWSENESSSASVNLSQDLFSGGGNTAKRKRALAQLKIGMEQYRQTLADVELNARLAYIEVVYAQELIELTQKIEERRAANVRLIQLRFDGGRENAGSLARTKAQLSQAAYESNEARRSLEYALRNLTAAIGLTTPVAGVTGTLNAAPPEALEDLEALMQQTSDYLIAATQVEASEQGFRVTRSARFPQVSLSAAAGVSDGSGFDSYDGYWKVGLNVSMSLYSGGQLGSDVAAAREQVIQSEMDLIATGNALLASLQQQWNSYANAIESETVQQELLDAEMLRAEISTAKYKQGLLSYEDWDTIESNVISQGKTHLQRIRSSEQQQAYWKNVLGLSVWQTVEEGE
jgi:outer membrane protein TolC